MADEAHPQDVTPYYFRYGAVTLRSPLPPALTQILHRQQIGLLTAKQMFCFCSGRRQGG